MNTIEIRQTTVHELTVRWEDGLWVVCPCQEGVCADLTEEQWSALEEIVIAH